MSSTNGSSSSILVADPMPTFRALMSEALTVGRDGVPVEVDAPSEVADVLAKRSSVSMVIFGPDTYLDDVRPVVSDMLARFPDVSAILVAREVSPEVLYESFRSGLRDVLPLSFTTNQLQEAIARARLLTHRLHGNNGATAAGLTHEPKVVTVMGVKTGCGASFVAANLAVLLVGRESPRVALVDLNLLSGDLAVMFQMRPKWSIAEVAQMDGLNDASLTQYLMPHRTGVSLLSAPFEPTAPSITESDVRRILSSLRREFPFVVVDTTTALPDQTFASLEESSEVILVLSLDVPSVRNAILSLQRLDQLGFSRERIRIVLNRSDSNVGLSANEVQKAIETNIDFLVPSSREVPISINQGNPLAAARRRSPVVAALEKLSRSVAGAPAPGRSRRFSRSR